MSKRDCEFSLAERFEFGNFTIKETCALKRRSHSGFYEDRKRGLVETDKIGTKTIVRGPIAKAYIEGRPIPEVA
jgi:hypothetical protein